MIGNLHEVVPAISAELRKGTRIAVLAGALGSPRSWRSAAVCSRAVPSSSSRLVPAGAAGSTAPATCPQRVRNEAVIVLGQRKLLQRVVPGLMHAFIFWGFLVLFPTIVAAAVAAVDKHLQTPWRRGSAYLVDVFVLLVLAGVVHCSS